MNVPCERCGAVIRTSVYEANDGLCTKCVKKEYPDWAQDPRADARSCWYASQHGATTSSDIYNVKQIIKSGSRRRHD